MQLWVKTRANMQILPSDTDKYVQLCRHRQRAVHIAGSALPCRMSINKLEDGLANYKLGIHRLGSDDSLIQDYTNFPTFRVFRAFH